jgi:long-chain acyl-CoA synthetase
MNFWELGTECMQRSSVIEAGGQVHSFGALLTRVTQQEQALAGLGSRTLGFLLCDNRLADLALYLACLRQGHVPLLLAAQTPPDQLAALKARYQPQWISTHGEPQAEPAATVTELHPALGLLLSTSGTTGSPRLVRLTRTSLQANAASIACYMQLSAKERAITSLPMHYSYGLSVINSHLLVGATLVLNTDSVFSREFLQRLREHQVTSLSGVPYMYQMLQRTDFFKQELPALRMLTQAGGRLDEKLMRLVAEHAQASGRRFFVMYGQTEACARISYVPPEQLVSKIGSIGVPIQDGTLEVAAESGELIYRGPNVMLGYAEQRADLGRGDDCQGRLHTGDLGRVDDDGFFYITGRLKRFIKVSGNRVSLDEVEQALQAVLQVPLAVGGTDDRLVVWLEAQEATLLDQVREFVRQQYAIHPTMTRLQLVGQLPLLTSGKKDYSALLRS